SVSLSRNQVSRSLSLTSNSSRRFASFLLYCSSLSRSLASYSSFCFSMSCSLDGFRRQTSSSRSLPGLSWWALETSATSDKKRMGLQFFASPNPVNVWSSVGETPKRLTRVWLERSILGRLLGLKDDMLIEIMLNRIMTDE